MSKCEICGMEIRLEFTGLSLDGIAQTVLMSTLVSEIHQLRHDIQHIGSKIGGA